MIGVLSRNDVTGLDWVLLGRVSSQSQKDNTSTAKQLNNLKSEVDEADGKIVKKYDLTESAASMDRSSLEEIATLAKENKVDVLGVWKLDRLSRASPWETILYLNRLRKEGVILYAHTHGYFEWDNLYDFEMLARRVVFAREWYQRIIEGGREGQLEKLEKGKWPFGSPPHGYTTDDDQVIKLTEKGEEINHDIVHLYLEYENMEKVHNLITQRHDKRVGISQIRNILQNPLLVGELTLEDQVVARDESLQVISPEKFEEIQDVRDKNSSTPSNTRDVPEPIDRAAFRFGVEYVIDIIDSVGTQCRRCESDLRPNGTTNRWGTKVRKYACANDDCGYEGPLLKQKEFDDLHQTLPLRCPQCPRTNRFEVEEPPAGFWDYKYTCKNCGTAFALDSPPNKLKRAMENPKLAFEWDNDTDLSEGEQKKTEGATSLEVSEGHQKTFAAY